MNVQMLQQAWFDWLKTEAYQRVRFGQYLSNHYDYMVGDSFYEANNGKVYEDAFKDLTISLSEI